MLKNTLTTVFAIAAIATASGCASDETAPPPLPGSTSTSTVTITPATSSVTTESPQPSAPIVHEVAPVPTVEVVKTFLYCDGHPLVGVYSGSDGRQYSVPNDPQCEQLPPAQTFAPTADVVKTFLYCDGHPLVGVYSGSDGRQYSVPNDPQCEQPAPAESTRPYPTQDEAFIETCMAKSGQTREECIADIQQGIDAGNIRVP